MAQMDRQGQNRSAAGGPDPRFSDERVAQVRQARRAAIRRRRILVVGLFLAGLALGVCAYVFKFSAWWASIPLALLVIVLILGARAARVARAWESALAQAQQAVGGPGAGWHGQAAHLTARGAVTRPDSQTGRPDQSAGELPQGQEVLENAPTHVIAVDDVRAVLRKQQEDKAAAMARRAQAKQRTQAKPAQVKQPGPAEPVADQGDAEAAAESEEPAHSAEIVSYKQVAKAQPLPPAEQAAIFADVTPSAAAFERVEAPARTDDSLGVDVDAVLARRQS